MTEGEEENARLGQKVDHKLKRGTAAAAQLARYQTDTRWTHINLGRSFFFSSVYAGDYYLLAAT